MIKKNMNYTELAEYLIQQSDELVNNVIAYIYACMPDTSSCKSKINTMTDWLLMETNHIKDYLHYTEHKHVKDAYATMWKRMFDVIFECAYVLAQYMLLEQSPSDTVLLGASEYRIHHCDMEKFMTEDHYMFHGEYPVMSLEYTFKVLLNYDKDVEEHRQCTYDLNIHIPIVIFTMNNGIFFRTLLAGLKDITMLRTKMKDGVTYISGHEWIDIQNIETIRKYIHTFSNMCFRFQNKNIGDAHYDPTAPENKLVEERYKILSAEISDQLTAWCESAFDNKEYEFNVLPLVKNLVELQYIDTYYEECRDGSEFENYMLHVFTKGQMRDFMDTSIFDNINDTKYIGWINIKRLVDMCMNQEKSAKVEFRRALMNVYPADSFKYVKKHEDLEKCIEDLANTIKHPYEYH